MRPAIRCSGAAAATTRSGTRRRSATTRTCSSSRTTTRKVFGKHFFKAGVLASANKKNEDTERQRLGQELAVLGRGRPQRVGRDDRQRARRLPAQGHDVGVLGVDRPAARPRSAGAISRSMRPTRGRWCRASRSTTACGIRSSTTRTRPTTRSRASCRRSSTRRSAPTPCNGLLEPPGHELVRRRRRASAAPTGPNRSLMTQDKNNIAPRVGRLPGTSSATARRRCAAALGQFFLRERLSPVLNIATNPPFVTTLTGIRKLDTTAEPCDGCFGEPLGAPAARPRSGHEDAEQLAVERHVPARDLAQHHHRGRLRRQQRLQPAARFGHQPGASAATATRNGIDDRLRVRHDDRRPMPALRPFGVFGDSNIGVWAHDGESTYHSLQTQFISRFGRRGSQVQSSYTLSRSRANMALTDSGSLAQNTRCWISGSRPRLGPP